MNGYCGKMLFVDLTSGECQERDLPQETAEKFIGGYGIGAKVLFDMMKPGVDALGPENIIGFTTGPLTATGALFGGRYTIVCKSPVTGGWNDANSGGYFGAELKKAGFDAVFVSGSSSKPVYLWINDGAVEIKDAGHLWGKDVVDTEKTLKEELGDKKLRLATIGQAGEKLSLISAVMNDGHRAAGRGGCGAVMGSKNLKAVVVRGKGSIPVADRDRLKAVNQDIMKTMKEGPMAQMVGGFSALGTTLMTSGSMMCGDAPVKNWAGAVNADFKEEDVSPFEGEAMDAKYRTKKFACASCPMGCGAVYKVEEGKWPVGETGRPEYETSISFGPLVMNKDVEALIKCNHICNLDGLDTISAGGTLAWAIECYENGLLSKEETGGLELTWGNGEALVQATREMADQNTEFGKLLALGSAAAAKKLGKGDEYLVAVKGIELPMHDPRFGPALARTYAVDPTPGRHVKGGIGLGPSPLEDKNSPKGSGPPDVMATAAREVMNSAGLCLFGNDFCGFPNMPRPLLEAVTGWKFGEEEEQAAGLRIFNLRQAFNVREGLLPADFKPPARSVGEPPLADGPIAGITVDHKGFIKNFYETIGWDEATGKPSRKSLEKLGGMQKVIEELNL